MKTAGPMAEEVEEEANYFARCLLMPPKLVKAWLRDNQGDFNDDRYTARLAKAFGVPVAVAVIRLVELKGE